MIPALAAALLLQAGDWDLRLSAWRARLDSGSVEFDERPADGDEIGVDGSVLVPELAATWRRAGWTARVRASRWELEGRERAAAPFRFNETLYPAGERVRTSLELLCLDARAGWTIEGPGGWTFELGAGAAWRFATVTLDSVSTRSDEDHQGSLLPELGATATLAISGGGEVRAELGGGGLAAGRFRGAAWEAGVSIALPLGRGWMLEAGYRAESARLRTGDSIQDNRVAWELRGPELGLGLRF